MNKIRYRRRCFVLVLVPLVLVGCRAEPVKPARFSVHPGVQLVNVTGAEPGQHLTLVAPDGRALVTLVADRYGQAHFAYLPEEHMVVETGEGKLPPVTRGRTLKPGDGYVIEDRTQDPPERSAPFRVLAVDDVPPEAFYARQRLHEGLNYIEMRDGVLLSATVWYPDATLWGPGPWPTVVNYSGYSPSNPDEMPPGGRIANLMLGYAVVGVNMRGTGCSGGVFDLFNPAQHADGYDVIEVVARQWFAKDGRVGMVGLSYPGISQLYVAYTRPPHLAAITPLSVIEDPWRQQWPGGVYNAGFTKNWLAERDRSAAPGGKSWVKRRIEAGDEICARNQLMHNQNLNFEAFAKALRYYPPDADERRLGKLVDRIEVPVFLTGAWQDEQTGSRFATMLDDFTTRVRRFTMFNGRHPDGYTPLVLTRWAEFLEFYVARRIPRIQPILRFFDQDFFREIFGPPGLHFEPDRFGAYVDYEEALAAYESEPPVRLLFESGYGGAATEAPVARFERSFASWPPPAEPLDLYLAPGGRLAETAPAEVSVASYWHDVTAGPVHIVRRDGIWHVQWRWEAATSANALGFLSEPFPEDTLIAGNGGWAELWFASEASMANVEVSVLEVRPEGSEFLVQTGVFNLEHRDGVDEERSGPFLIEYTYYEEDARPLVPYRFERVRIPIRPFAHLFRAGSRIRIVIDTPGRDHGFWAFENPDYGGDLRFVVGTDAVTRDVRHFVAFGGAYPSFVRLPRVVAPDLLVPDPPPPCYSLRGIYCRRRFLELVPTYAAPELFAWP